MLHRHRHHDRRRRLRRNRRRKRSPRHRNAYGDNPIYATCWMSAATTRSACAARRTPGRRKSVARLQHAVRGNSPRKFPPSPDTINDQSERLLTLRGLMELQVSPSTRCRWRGRTGGGDRQALRHRCDELRLDLARGAHHAGDRDEPDRRQVEHRRGRRGIRSLQAAAERQFDALGDQAGGIRPVRRHRPSIWSTPTICRSRWRRAPSRARAASCRATRWTRTSPACGIRRRASD